MQFHRLYFHSNIAYWLNQVDKRIDNCDQRMTVEYVQRFRNNAVRGSVLGYWVLVHCRFFYVGFRVASY
jgi:hypothetical protein